MIAEQSEVIKRDSGAELEDYRIEERNIPKQHPWLLGYHLAKGRDEVIVTASAADTLTALDCLAVPAVCLPSGNIATRWHSQSRFLKNFFFFQRVVRDIQFTASNDGISRILPQNHALARSRRPRSRLCPCLCEETGRKTLPLDQVPSS